MRDITHKPVTVREAVARATLLTGVDPQGLLAVARADKGDALEIARIAAIMAAKRTHDLIPLCHPIPVTWAEVSYRLGSDRIDVEMTVRTVAQTGCEIEAIQAVATCCVTLWDVLKPHCATLRIDAVTLIRKSGGKSDTSR